MKSTHRAFLNRFNTPQSQSPVPLSPKRTTSNSNPLGITSNLSQFPTQVPNAQSSRKFISQLQQIATQERKRREQIELRYEQFKERFINREKEFYRIINNLNAKVTQEATKDDIYINEVYQKIVCTFDAFNEKARQLLEDRYSQLYRLMERRIDLLMQKMDKELSKYRKITEAERKQIHEDIRQVGTMAADIEKENIEIRKKYDLAQLKLQLLNDQKKIMLSQITQLKRVLGEISKKQKGRQSMNNKTLTVKETSNPTAQFWNNMQSIQIESPYPSPVSHRRTLTSHSNRYSVQPTKKPSVSQQHNNFLQTHKQKRVMHSSQNAIQHLKTLLAREKTKNGQIVKFSLELEAKLENVRKLVERELGRERQAGNRRKESKGMGQSVQIRDQYNEYSNRNDKDNDMNNANCDPKNPNTDPNPTTSQLLTELNKILHLPQTPAPSTTIQLPLQSSNLLAQQPPTYPLPSHRHLYPKPKQILSNKSSEAFKQPKMQKSLLKVSYSPLDWMDIAKSIEIGDKF